MFNPDDVVIIFSDFSKENKELGTYCPHLMWVDGKIASTGPNWCTEPFRVRFKTKEEANTFSNAIFDVFKVRMKEFGEFLRKKDDKELSMDEMFDKFRTYDYYEDRDPNWTYTQTLFDAWEGNICECDDEPCDDYGICETCKKPIS